MRNGERRTDRDINHRICHQYAAGPRHKVSAELAAQLGADGTSLYETTNIPVEALPDDLRADLDKGRYIETPEELYGFLENYSS